ncbi:MAG: hypothetical protein K0U84_06015 [Actinomycetia bacterium]|nr:hypothetical protein [Actinomycetes bacterium]
MTSPDLFAVKIRAESRRGFSLGGRLSVGGAAAMLNHDPGGQTLKATKHFGDRDVDRDYPAHLGIRLPSQCEMT